MENETLETINHKGLTIKIFQDISHQNSPDDWEDSNLFLVHYHRDFEITRDEIITKDEVGAILTGDYERFDNGSGYFKNNCKVIEKKYHTFGVDAYIHSGVSLSLTGGFGGRLSQGHERFDVSSVGLILVSKKETKNKKKARELAKGLIESWNDNLSGNIYGYVIENKTGNNLGSCWGFYGDYNKSGIIEEAKAETEGIIKQKTKKHIQRLKNQIKNGVSINKREPVWLFDGIEEKAGYKIRHI